MPPGEVILQDANKTLLRIVAFLSTGGRREDHYISVAGEAKKFDVPEEKIWMSHKVCDSLEHTPWLEDKRWKCYTREIHADSVYSVVDHQFYVGDTEFCEHSLAEKLRM
jgi:hypothetical protein